MFKIYFVLLFFVALGFKTSAQTYDESGKIINEDCLKYQSLLEKVDSVYTEMRSCDAQMNEITDMIEKRGLDDQSAQIFYMKIEDLKKQKIKLQEKLREYAILAKPLEQSCN